MGALFKEEWLKGPKYPKVFAYYFKQWSNYAMNFHTHDSVEIMYVLSGECRIDLEEAADGKREKNFLLRKGEFMMLDANTPHRLIVDDTGPCRMLNVEFAMRDRESVFPSFGQLASEDPYIEDLAKESSSYLVLRDSDEVYPLLKSLVLELDAKEERGRMRIELLFAQLLLAIAHIRQDHLQESHNAVDRYLKEAIAYIHHNYDRPIQVKDIAASVNLHPGYLHRLFSAGMNRTLSVYLNDLRMEKAKMLLRQTDIPVADICDYVGVGSRAYFHALFKKYTGTTPIAYRSSFQPQHFEYESDDI
ncbi:AraC family transcriptional regulator [Paenibacillus sp. HB172176]|uniref:AraC family transcriptional regulator n=1 Tax=Paenibacillus sp. HB172176 TaxID=2493690 RepID=UPI00143C1566|nr:AraC family transcriptional regulator [Paenibacillus sp. HB172176]